MGGGKMRRGSGPGESRLATTIYSVFKTSSSFLYTKNGSGQKCNGFSPEIAFGIWYFALFLQKLDSLITLFIMMREISAKAYL